MNGLLDTSVFIAKEQKRKLGKLPDQAAISVITLAELHLGVLLAKNAAIRAQRLRTLAQIEHTFEALEINDSVARTFATIAADARDKGRKPKIMDTLIAATAITYSFTVFTQDRDFGGINNLKVVYV